jgi:beta-exotoxin I transport system ATP-binding protein
MLLRTEHLTKRYGSFTALDDLNLAIAPSEVVGLLGPNGSGKTTALRLVLGFLRPSAGRATVAGHDCWSDSVAVRRQIAYLPGELRLYENMTGRQLVRFLGELRGERTDGEVDALARRFEVDVDRPLANLSSGMKRKVALLTVLVPRTPLVIMDEPTNALDPTMRDLLLERVRQAKERGQAVLFSSHVLAEVERVCDRVVILQRGRLAHEQVMADLQEGRLVVARFAGPAQEPPDLPGLRLREKTADRLTIEYGGPLPDLLGWLSNQSLVELRVEPLGLNAVYHRYHGNPE